MKEISTYVKIWTDPVWSVVISWVIILIITQIFVFIWSLIIKIKFFHVYQNMYFRIKNFTKKESKTSTNDKAIEIVETNIRIAPTVFFHYRFTDAFPGFTRGYQEFNSTKDIESRLKVLLQSPLRFDKGEGYGIDTRPIWWFRGGSALPIERFEILDRKKILLNSDELIIEKLVAYRGHYYYQDFVYLECKPDKTTGLYKHNELDMKNAYKEGGVYYEEFAIFRKKFISIQDYDDGATIIRGKPVKIVDAKLRSRTLIKYNFIICAKFAPYNSPDFSDKSKGYFMNLLENKISFEDFICWMNKLPKNPND